MFVIPGAHRPETILDSLKADQLELTPEELASSAELSQLPCQGSCLA